ncbi:MAG: glycosyltransferase [Chloroflexota bacterium]
MNKSSLEIQNWLPKENIVKGMVSVIIPNYNHARYLPFAIDSILEQTYQNFEIIVIDDGSKDNSREVGASYGDKINYIYKENAGLSAARNTGLRHAHGEFIGLLDADDMYEPHFMQTLVEFLTENQQYDGVYCGYQFVDDDGFPLPQIENRVIPSEMLYEAMWGGNFWVPESVLMRRGCYITAGPYDESLRACEDWDVWLRILAAHPIAGVPDVLIRHRVLPGSMSSDPIRMLTNRMQVTENQFGTLDDPKSFAAEKIQWIYSQNYFGSAIEYIQFGNLERAYELIEKAVRLYPELLMQEGTFFELGVGDQPKGSRGQLDQINLVANEKIIAEFLEKLLSLDIIPTDQNSQVWGLAYQTLAKIAYGGNDSAQARKFMLKAAGYDKGLMTSSSFIKFMAKSTVGPELTDKLKRLRS